MSGKTSTLSRYCRAIRTSNARSNSITLGLLQYYQTHYIVKLERENGNVLANCEPLTKGHFRSKRVVDVKRTGAKFAEVLQQDAKLTEVLKEVMMREGEISANPSYDYVTIYGKAKVFHCSTKALITTPADEVTFNSPEKLAILWKSSLLSSLA